MGKVKVLPTLDVVAQERMVAPAGLEEEIEDIAQERYGADDSVEADIGNHPCDQPLRGAEMVGAPNEIKGGPRRSKIADSGNKPEHRVETEADPGARNAPASVQPCSEVVEFGQYPVSLGSAVPGGHPSGEE